MTTFVKITNRELYDRVVALENQLKQLTWKVAIISSALSSGTIIAVAKLTPLLTSVF